MTGKLSNIFSGRTWGLRKAKPVGASVKAGEYPRKFVLKNELTWCVLFC